MAFKTFNINLIGTIKNLMTCCGGTVEFVGVIGILLLIAGTFQMGSGVYFMLSLPVFSVASNIWTGVVSGLTGTVLTYFGCSDQAQRRPYLLFTFCIVAIVANIANLVVIQVGDKTLNVFNEESFLRNMDEAKELTLKTGVWITTGATILSLASSFILANYLFCGQLKGRCETDKQPPLLKTISEEVLQKASRSKSKKGGSPNRFFPPSRLLHDSKEHIQTLPSIEDVLTLPNPNFTNGNSSWVYNSDDKISLGLYPLGLEVHLDVLETSVRHPPARHSSFAAPRYAKVNKRPQRAQSFAPRRDPFSLQYDNHLLKPCPVLIPRLPRDNRSRVRRSNSLTTESSCGHVARSLSSKYRAFTLDREVYPQVLEVGSLKSSSSEHSLANALTDLPPERTKISTNEKYTAFNKFSDNDNASSSSTLKGSTTLVLTKGFRTKGPAPPPPTKDISRNRGDELMLSSVYKQAQDLHHLSGDTCTNAPKQTPTEPGSKMETQNEMEELNNSETYDSHSDRFQMDPHILEEIPGLLELDSKSFTRKSQRKKQLTHFTAQRNGEIKKPLRTSLSKEANPDNPIPHLQITPERERKKHCHDLFPEVGTSPDIGVIYPVEKDIILNSSPTKNILKDISVNYNHYDTVRKQTPDISKMLLKVLPNKEVARNKIVLRVPSFKTTGCQTENNRTVKRRNTLCSQGHNNLYNLQPSEQLSKMAVWRQQHESEEPKLIALSTSSSGYSSPERNSKESSPIHSGPPSPGSSYETGTEEESNGCDQNGPNITIIEVNKGFNKQFKAPSRPPKPLRYRTVSDASTLYGSGISPYLKKPSMPLPICEDIFGRSKISENMLLTEAVNPLMHNDRNSNTTTPRIVNVLEKSTTRHPELPCKGVDTNNNHQKFTINHASIHRFCNELMESQQQTFQKRTENDSSLSQDNGNFFESSSTAAYLASLELLASHYRQQALANAKQLQRQQRLLDQQKKHSQSNPEEVQIGINSELPQPHNFILRNHRNTE